MRPPGTSTFCVCSARATSLTVRFCARSSSAFEPEIDLALAAADDQHLADAVRALELPAQHLVGVLGDLAQRLLRGDRDGQHRRGRRIELLDGRLDHGARQQRDDAVDLVAHLLRRDVRVLLEHERDDDLRDAFGRVRGQRVDAADRVDGFLDLVGDLGLDLLRRGAGQPRRDRDRRDVDVGKAIDAEPREGEQRRRPTSERMSTQAKTGRLTQSSASHCMASAPALTRGAVLEPLEAADDHAIAGARGRSSASTRSPSVWPIVISRSST